MKHVEEDETSEGKTPGVVPDWVSHGGTAAQGYRDIRDGQGPKIDNVMARETTKQANLRARLCDLGVPIELRERCFVHGDVDPALDAIDMPWSVIYFLIESDERRGRETHHRMGVMS